jgi:hypothetical protein
MNAEQAADEPTSLEKTNAKTAEKMIVEEAPDEPTTPEETNAGTAKKTDVEQTSDESSPGLSYSVDFRMSLMPAAGQGADDAPGDFAIGSARFKGTLKISLLSTRNCARPP